MNTILSVSLPVSMAEAIQTIGHGNRSKGFRTLLDDQRVVAVIQELVPKYASFSANGEWTAYWGPRDTPIGSAGWKARDGFETNKQALAFFSSIYDDNHSFFSKPTCEVVSAAAWNCAECSAPHHEPVACTECGSVEYRVRLADDPTE